MLEAYQMGASIDELSKFSLTDLSNKAPGYFVKMVEKAGEQFKVFADLYDYVASINKSLLKKNTIKNLLDSIAKGQIAAKRKFGESLELTDDGDLIGISENYKPDFVKEFVSLQKKRQQDLNKEIAKVTGTESNVNVLPEYYNSLLKLFEPSTTPQIEEKKIKETAKTEPKKVEESKVQFQISIRRVLDLMLMILINLNIRLSRSHQRSKPVPKSDMITENCILLLMFRTIFLD